jgi:hypothetical protein
MDSLLAAVEQIFRQRRVVSATITAGSIEYVQALPDEAEDPGPITLQLDTVSPLELLRTAENVELPLQPELTGIAHFADVLQECTRGNLAPLAWVLGPETLLWAWLQTTGFRWVPRSDFLGLQVLVDSHAERENVILAAGYTPHARLTNVQRGYITKLPLTVA